MGKLMSPAEEAAAILKLADNDTRMAFDIIQKQFDVMYGRAQSVVGMASIIVTVTGFSGRLIAGTNVAAQVFVIAGLAVALLGAGWVVWRVMLIDWLTAHLSEDPVASLGRMVATRNAKTRAVAVGGWLLLAGLTLYFVAISIMLANPTPLQVPVR